MSACLREEGRSHRAEHVACAELVLTGINPEPGINQTQITAMQLKGLRFKCTFFFNFDTEAQML